MGQRFFFSVGEPSGDLHAANLLRSLKSLSPSSTFRGLVGEDDPSGFGFGLRLDQHGCRRIQRDTPQAARVLSNRGHGRTVLSARRSGWRRFGRLSSFNWHIAKRAKKYGIPSTIICHRNCGHGELASIQNAPDSGPCFLQLAIRNSMVRKEPSPGNFCWTSIFDNIAQQPLDVKFVQRWRDNDRVQVCVLPGSRDHEVKHIWPLQLEVIRNRRKNFPTFSFWSLPKGFACTPMPRPNVRVRL